MIGSDKVIQILQRDLIRHEIRICCVPLLFRDHRRDIYIDSLPGPDVKLDCCQTLDLSCRDLIPACIDILVTGSGCAAVIIIQEKCGIGSAGNTGNNIFDSGMEQSCTECENDLLCSGRRCLDVIRPVSVCCDSRSIDRLCRLICCQAIFMVGTALTRGIIVGGIVIAQEGIRNGEPDILGYPSMKNACAAAMAAKTIAEMHYGPIGEEV